MTWNSAAKDSCNLWPAQLRYDFFRCLHMVDDLTESWSLLNLLLRVDLNSGCIAPPGFVNVVFRTLNQLCSVPLSSPLSMLPCPQYKARCSRIAWAANPSLFLPVDCQLQSVFVALERCFEDLYRVSKFKCRLEMNNQNCKTKLNVHREIPNFHWKSSSVYRALKDLQRCNILHWNW